MLENYIKICTNLASLIFSTNLVLETIYLVSYQCYDFAHHAGQNNNANILRKFLTLNGGQHYFYRHYGVPL